MNGPYISAQSGTRASFLWCTGMIRTYDRMPTLVQLGTGYPHSMERAHAQGTDRLDPPRPVLRHALTLYISHCCCSHKSEKLLSACCTDSQKVTNSYQRFVCTSTSKYLLLLILLVHTSTRTTTAAVLLYAKASTA